MEVRSEKRNEITPRQGNKRGTVYKRGKSEENQESQREGEVPVGTTRMCGNNSMDDG